MELTHNYMKKWSRILQRPISLLDWGKIWESASKFSRCVVQKETAIKILLFWYRTPDLLHARNPTTSNICWRCSESIGSHFHIFWDCPLIGPYWTKIQDLLQTLLSTPIPLNPMHFLLRLPFPGISKASQKPMSFILLAAKRAFLRHWLSTSPPTFHHFLSIMADIRRMGHLTAKTEDTLPSFYKIWKTWDDSVYSLESDNP